MRERERAGKALTFNSGDGSWAATGVAGLLEAVFSFLGETTLLAETPDTLALGSARPKSRRCRST